MIHLRKESWYRESASQEDLLRRALLESYRAPSDVGLAHRAFTLGDRLGLRDEVLKELSKKSPQAFLSLAAEVQGVDSEWVWDAMTGVSPSESLAAAHKLKEVGRDYLLPVLMVGLEKRDPWGIVRKYVIHKYTDEITEVPPSISSYTLLRFKEILDKYPFEKVKEGHLSTIEYEWNDFDMTVFRFDLGGQRYRYAPVSEGVNLVEQWRALG